MNRRLKILSAGIWECDNKVMRVRKMNSGMVTGVNIAVMMGIFVFLGTAWAVEPKPLTHPVLDHSDRQPSRILYEAQMKQGAAERPGMYHGRDVAVAKMNQIEFRQTMQRLTAPNAFQAQQPVVTVPNANRRPQ